MNDITEMVLVRLEGDYLICKSNKVRDISDLLCQEFISCSWSDGYFSYICKSDVTIESDKISKEYWSCLKIQGSLDFSLSGILSAILEPLRKSDVSVLVISTYETDFIFVPRKKLEIAINALEFEGYSVI
ncbi:hypothetical protein OURE66S_00846 [Oligella ureolytica]